jgi:hypothetical protein
LLIFSAIEFYSCKCCGGIAQNQRISAHPVWHEIWKLLRSSGVGSRPERGTESAMKLVMAVIKPFKLDEVREALTPLGVQGLAARRARPKSTAARNIM